MNKEKRILHKLVDLMYDGNHVPLTDKGKAELSEYNQDDRDEGRQLEWNILAVKYDGTLEICSEYYDIIGIPSDYININ